MTKQHRMLLGWAASIAIGLAAGGVAIGGSASGGPIACEIAQTRSGGMIVLEGIVTATRPVAGHYAFSTRGPGARIDQSGPFEAAAGERATLGSIMIGSGGIGQDVRLEVSSAGYATTCSKRAGSI